MDRRIERVLDEVGWQLLAALLEDAGVIRGYRLDLGYAGDLDHLVVAGRPP